jgi:5'(3')-deoxyribonucleotidase
MKNKKIRQIFLDQDGVLADFESTCSRMLGLKVWNTDEGHKLYDEHKRELTAKHMFRQMNPLPDAWKLVDYCMNSGIHTEILTAAGTVNRTIVVQDKIDWIREHIHPNWIVIPTFKGSQKAAFAHKKSVLIDDRSRNIDCWVEAGGIGILHKTADQTIKELDYIISDEYTR